jgi:hypothetical protein
MEHSGFILAPLIMNFICIMIACAKRRQEEDQSEHEESHGFSGLSRLKSPEELIEEIVPFP